MYVCMSVSVSVCLSACLPACLYVYLYVVSYARPHFWGDPDETLQGNPSDGGLMWNHIHGAPGGEGHNFENAYPFVAGCMCLYHIQVLWIASFYT